MSELRQDRLEARLGRIEETVARIDERLAASLPHLATKAELADLLGENSRLRSDLLGDSGRLRSDMTGEIGKLRAEIADKPSRGLPVGRHGGDGRRSGGSARRRRADFCLCRRPRAERSAAGPAALGLAAAMTDLA